tara:strand:- start:1103 stop:1342 length:240 start_codon:yes stop_codon:yes gene_type:complete
MAQKRKLSDYLNMKSPPNKAVMWALVKDFIQKDQKAIEKQLKKQPKKKPRTPQQKYMEGDIKQSGLQKTNKGGKIKKKK